jgi:hypothetical protein
MSEPIESDIIPLGIYKGLKLTPQLVPRANYYEWNSIEEQWTKLNDKDPDPPTYLPAGKFDGQIIEISKDTDT